MEIVTLRHQLSVLRAFRRLYPVDCGLFTIDDLGKAQGLGPISRQPPPLRYDRQGGLVAKARFAHGVYRLTCSNSRPTRGFKFSHSAPN